MNNSRIQSVVVTPHLIRGVAIVVLLAGVCGYFGWHVYNLFRPPYVVVTNPVYDIMTTQETIDLVGNTRQDNDIFINEVDVEVTKNGAFRKTFTLQDGLNVFEVKAVNRFGKETIITKKINKQ